MVGVNLRGMTDAFVVGLDLARDVFLDAMLAARASASTYAFELREG